MRSVEADVCIIGSGASGSIVAAKLVSSGLRVAVVEQGLHIGPTEDFDDVIARAEPAMVRLDNGAWAPMGYPWTSCNVGGGPTFYGAASFRLRNVDFQARNHVARADFDVNWPIDYTDLAPYYDDVEQALGLSGDSPTTDPTHPGGSPPPLPAIDASPQARRLRRAGERCGLSPFATPLMICSRPFRHRPSCSFCSPCIEHRCPDLAKADTFSLLLKPLLASGNVSLYDGHKAIGFCEYGKKVVRELDTIDVRTGEHTRLRAAAFVLAANAIQSAAILLRSREMLSESVIKSAFVGRGLCMKLNNYIVGHSQEPCPPLSDMDPWRHGIGPFSTIASTDYYLSADCPTGLGGLIYEARYGWQYGDDPCTDVARLECLIGDTPSAQNRVRLSDTTDRFGIPFVALDYRAHPRDTARLHWLSTQAAHWLQEAGYSSVWTEPGGYQLGSSHLHGTCRAGSDPQSSVADKYGRIHDLDNVFTADGAYMPYPGAVNPTLTIQAIAAMVADAVSTYLTHMPSRLRDLVPAI